MNLSNFNLGKNLENLETSEAFDAYARVDVVLGEDEEGNVITVSYPANVADDAGRILTVEMPMCTDTTLARTAAQRIFNSLTNKDPTAFQYQPMQADGALADPSMEFGDSIDANGVHGGFYTRSVSFGRLMKTDLSSPSDEEIDHEYPYEDSQQRQITRTNKELKSGLYVTSQAITAEVEAREADSTEFRSQLSIQATQIAAKVNATGGNNSSFGWVLDSTGHTWYSGSRQVMKVDSSGLEVTGKITATSGQIGGFTIGSSSIYSNGMSSMSSTQTTGVHVGTDGIKLGQNFKVDTSGNVTAARGTFGSLNVSSGGSTYSGGLSGCGGSVSSGLSYGGGYGTLGGMSAQVTTNANNIGSLDNRINAIYTNYLNALSISSGTLSVSGSLQAGDSVTGSSGVFGSLVLGGRGVGRVTKEGITYLIV